MGNPRSELPGSVVKPSHLGQGSHSSLLTFLSISFSEAAIIIVVVVALPTGIALVLPAVSKIQCISQIVRNVQAVVADL
jgi:hypothetical protein